MGRFLLALAKGPSGLLGKIVTDGVLTIRQNCQERGSNEALIVRFRNEFFPKFFDVFPSFS